MFALIFLFAAAPTIEEPTFVVEGAGVKSAPVRGWLAKLNAEGAELRTPSGVGDIRDVISIHRADRLVPIFPTGPQLITANGDRIPGRVTGGDANSIQFEPSFDVYGTIEWKLPFAAASVVWFTTQPADTSADPTRYPWRGEERRDVLRLRNGDVLRGTVERFEPDHAVYFKPDGGDARQFKFASLAAISFNPSLSRPRKPRGVYSHVVFADGTRLNLTAATADAKNLKGKTTFGIAVTIPLTDVLSLDIFQGKATYLSDLTPKATEQTDFLGVPWQVGRDRTAGGNPLRLAMPEGNSTFDKGLSCRPRCKVTFALDGKYRRFDTVLGLDAANKRGAATARILVDSKDRLDAANGKLTAGRSQSLSLDISGAKELILVVDFGSSGGVDCDVNWGNARLIE